MPFARCYLCCTSVTIIIINYGGFFVQMRNYLRVVTRWLRSDVSPIALFWLAGLILGTAVFQPDASLMRPQLCGRVSIVSAIATAAFPLLLAALAVHINRKKFLWLICFLKAFSFSFCGVLLWRTYGSSGWLIRFLLMFTDICTLPAFLWYCFRRSRRDFVVCILISLSVACINYFVVSPFSAELIMI